MIEILLGKGLVYVDGVAVGLTRGGGKFTVDREFKDIEADGDYGPVKERTYITKEIPKFMFKLLQNIAAKFPTLYPGMVTSSITGSFSGVAFTGTATKSTGNLTIATGDFHTIQFVGQKLDGTKISIVILNGLNKEGIAWDLIDKDEIVPEATFTGHYTEGSTTPPWYFASVA